MNISLRPKTSEHLPRSGISAVFRKVFRLESGVAVALAILLYSLLAQHLFTPSTVTVPTKVGASVLVSTDVDTALRPSLERAILGAKQSILLIIYSLSDSTVVNALRGAAEKNVEVTVIHDPVETPDAAFMLGKKITCYPRRSRGLMHNKLLVIDHTRVWIGSANMSTKSLTEQGNLVVAVNSPAIATAIETLGSAMIDQVRPETPPHTCTCAGSQWTLYFHPYHGKESFQALVSRIERASKRVFVAMFTFTHPELVNALSRARARGVDVRVVLDQGSAHQTSRLAYTRFKREGLPCGYRTKTGLLHYKVALIDDMLVAGSCNWTKAGFLNNHEAMLFIDPIPECHKKWLERWWKAVEQTSSLVRE
jgi:phosphatidylserine/phosphatidylglycerophosphate/cardiolipin synthase-like enzyme